jgi:hypothetical protein
MLRHWSAKVAGQLKANSQKLIAEFKSESVGASLTGV